MLKLGIFITLSVFCSLVMPKFIVGVNAKL